MKKLFSIDNIDGLKQRMKFRSKDYFILPGVNAFSPKLKNFRLELYLRLTAHFGYSLDQQFLENAGCVNYGNLLYDTAKSDDPAFYEIDDNADAYRRDNGLGPFPQKFVDIYYEEWCLAFQKFLDSDYININLTNGSSSGPPLYYKSALSKIDLVRNTLNNADAVKKALETYNVKGLFYLTSFLPVAAPVKRTRNDKAAIYRGKEKIDPSQMDIDAVKQGLKSKKLEIIGKPRPVGTTNGITLKEYRGHDILFTPSRLAYSVNGIGNYILQPIATAAMQEPGYKMSGYDEYERILEQGLFSDDGVEFAYLIGDYTSFDRFHSAALVAAFIKAAYKMLPLHTARLIEMVESIQLPRFSKNYPGFYLNRDPFVWDPNFLDNFVSLQSGVWHTSKTGKIFTRAAIRYALGWTSQQMIDALAPPTKNKPFLKDGGDDFWLKIEKHKVEPILKVLNTIMDVKLEIPAAFLGLKFANLNGRLRAVPDPASFIKSFNPENKSSNFLKYKGLTFDQILLYYSINPEFTQVKKIVYEVFYKHFQINLRDLMKLHSNVTVPFNDLTIDELLFLMKPERIHYTEAKVRDSIKQLFYTSSEDITVDLFKFLRGY